MGKIFKLAHYKTDVSTEIRAGIVTFLAMAYIVVVNPLILADAGIPLSAAFFATVFIAGTGTIVMGFRANLPIAIAPGMGMNAFFTYTVVKGMGMSWEMALAAIFFSGILFILISMSGLRKIIIDAIPIVLKHAIVVAVGIFIAFIGMRQAGIVVSPETHLITLADGTTSVSQDQLVLQLGNIHSPEFILTLLGVVVTLVLVIRKSKYAILIGILSVVLVQFILTKMGIFSETTAISINVAESFSAFGKIFNVIPSALMNPQFYFVVFTFLFLDFFDTSATLIAATQKLSDSSNENTDERMEKALVVDAFATTAGAVVGTTSVTTYLESFTGIDAGGRTGLTSIVTGILLLLSFFLYPFIGLVSAQATAAALIMIGIFMMQTLKLIDFDDLTEVIVLFFTILITLFSTSISVGISVGFLTYILVNIASGKTRDISPVVWILGAMFLLNFIFGHTA